MMGLNKELASVHGIKLNGEEVSFGLTGFEVKHIRRCLRYRAFMVPDREGGLTSNILEKFMKLGRLERRSSQQTWKKIRERLLPKKCAACGSTERLTIHHKTHLSDGCTNNLSNLEWLCKRCHAIKNFQYRISMKKNELEHIKSQFNSFMEHSTKN